jgi:hypothetical protein
MRNRSLRILNGFSGVTIGGSGSGQPLPLVILTVVVLAMALVTVYDAIVGGPTGVDLNKQIPFKCVNPQCGTIVKYTIRELQKMAQPGGGGPMMGPMTLNCPKCNQKTLTQAVECPKCQFIFVMQIDPAHNKFDDRCPKCGISYAKAWQDKYRQSGGDD